MDLQTIFSAILNMTITGSIVILCVLLARLALKKAPKSLSCLLWAAVLFRLLCPVSLSAPVSVLSLVDAPATREVVGAVEYIQSPVSAPLETIQAGPAQEAVPSISTPEAAPIDWHLIASRVWALGAGLLAAHGVISYVNLKRRLRTSAPLQKGVRESDAIPTPFVLGFLKPIIYLPSDLDPRERPYILLHERCHIRHLDHWVRLAFYVAACLHWFNPLVWLAFSLSARDMELRCDEAVLKRLGGNVRSDYAQSLLNLATGRRIVLCAPLAFGEGDTGERVKHVLSWKRKKLWMVVPAAVLCAVVLAVTAMNPPWHLSEEQNVFGKTYRAEAVLGQAVPEGLTYYLREDDLHLIRSQSDTHDDLGVFSDSDLLAFDLDDEALESDLRRHNEHVWRTREGYRFLLWQEDGSVYMTEGRDRVLRLDRIHRVGVRIQTPEDFGAVYNLEPQPLEANSGLLSGENSAVLLSGDATLVFTTSADPDILTVREEYFLVRNDGTTAVSYHTHTLSRTRDYGYELPITRRDYPERELEIYAEDMAVYTIELGMSRYRFTVHFPPNSGPETRESTPPEQTREVTFSEGGAYITLQLPESWEYEITSFSENQNAAGISFRPGWYDRGWLHLNYYPDGFGVCGTGLHTSAGMVLAGREAVTGTYDNHTVWDYISFGDDFAVIGEEQAVWWAEYGDAAMAILDSAQLGTTQP